MPDPQNLLSALQHADSFFPSGGVAFSSGLETLLTDREVASVEQLGSFVDGQLKHRWSTSDACALVAAFRANGMLHRIAGVDAIVEAMSLATELREGSIASLTCTWTRRSRQYSGRLTTPSARVKLSSSAMKRTSHGLGRRRRAGNAIAAKGRRCIGCNAPNSARHSVTALTICAPSSFPTRLS